jgi:O-antigen ligase
MHEPGNIIEAQKINMTETFCMVKKYVASFYGLVFLALLSLVSLTVIEIKIGLAILAGLVLLVTVLIRPQFIYLLMLSLLSFEGFSALESVSYPKIVGLLLIIGLTLRLALTKELIPKDSAYKYFFLFFTGSLVSFAVAANFSLNLRMYITYIALFIFYIFTRYFIKSMDDISRALNFIFLSTILVFAFVQIMGLSVRSGVSSRIASGIGDPNAFASYIMVLVPLVFYQALNSSGISRTLYWSCLVSFLLLLVLTGSRGGVLGFLGATGVLIYYYGVGKTKYVVLLTITITTIAFLFIPDTYWKRMSTIMNPQTEEGSSIETRLDNYKAAVKMFLDYPIVGVGMYHFKYRSSDYGASRGKVVHNTYLEVLTGGGLLSFIPFSLILMNSWRKLKLRRKYGGSTRDLLICLKASFVSILITSSFISGDHEKILFLLLALISSAHYASVKQNKYNTQDF